MNISNAIKKILLRLSSIVYQNRSSKILFYHDIYDKIWYRALDCNENMGTPIALFKQHVETIKKEG